MVDIIVLPIGLQTLSLIHPLGSPCSVRWLAEYLHLSSSGDGRASHRTAMPCSCLQSLHGISNSVKFGACTWDGSQVGLVTRWPFLLSFLHSCLVPAFLSNRKNSGSKLLKVVSRPIPPLDIYWKSICWRWSLQVPSHHCWAFWLRAHQLNPRNLSQPRSLGDSKGSPIQIPHPPQLHISIPSPGPLEFSPVFPPYLILLPFPLTLSSPIQVSPSLCLP